MATNLPQNLLQRMNRKNNFVAKWQQWSQFFQGFEQKFTTKSYHKFLPQNLPHKFW